MAVPVEALFHQNAWSTERLIEACETLSPEQLDAEAPGTCGTVRSTLAHIVIAEQHYILRLGGKPAQPLLKDDGSADLGVLKRIVEENGEILASMAANSPPDWQVKGVTEYGVAFDTQGVVFLLQAVNHATSHRQQVVSWLSSQGLGPKDLDEEIDAWSWGVATGALKTG